MSSVHCHTRCMDDDFLDLIDQAFLEGQIDGETMELACIWLQFVQSDSKGNALNVISHEVVL